MTSSNNQNSVNFSVVEEEKLDNQDDEFYKKKLLDAHQKIEDAHQELRDAPQRYLNQSIKEKWEELIALNHTTWKALFEASEVSNFGLLLLQYRKICDLIKTSRVKAQDILNITNQSKNELLFAGAALIQREFLSIEDLIHPEESSELSSKKYSEFLKKRKAISNLEHFVQNKEDAEKIYSVKTDDDYLELKKELVEKHPKIQLLKSEQLLSDDFLNQIPCDSQLMHLLDERVYTLIKANKMTVKQFLGASSRRLDAYFSNLYTYANPIINQIFLTLIKIEKKIVKQFLEETSGRLSDEDPSNSRSHTNQIVDYINQLNPKSFYRDFDFEEAIAEHHVSPVNMDDFLKARGDAAFKEVSELNKNRLDRGMLVEQVSEKLFKQSKFVFSLFQGRKDHLEFVNEINIGSIYYFQKLERDQSILNNMDQSIDETPQHNDLPARAISSCCSRFWKGIQFVLSQEKHPEHTTNNLKLKIM